MKDNEHVAPAAPSPKIAEDAKWAADRARQAQEHRDTGAMPSQVGAAAAALAADQKRAAEQLRQAEKSSRKPKSPLE